MPEAATHLYCTAAQSRFAGQLQLRYEVQHLHLTHVAVVWQFLPIQKFC